MSGGVDSSVAAALLQEQGYDVVGVTMQVWDYSKDECQIDEGNGTCCSSLDVDDARAVADKLNIPFYVINCEEEFQHKVIDDFVSKYLKGQTPIPCVNCNTFLKFDHLIKKMRELNCDYLATGHYAQVLQSESGEFQIHTSEDSWKDQTYFLFTLAPEVLSKLIFPVGTWQKSDLRGYAEKAGLQVFNKKDSTGICFIGPKGYAHFIETQVDASKLKKGKIKDKTTGAVLAEHDGIHRFTVGQRKGVGVATGSPMYVVAVDHETGDVWLGPETELYSKTVFVSGLNLLAKIEDGEKIRVKIRYAHSGASAAVSFLPDGTAKIDFDEPQRAITRGQAAVFYREKHLLGGGWITGSMN